MSLITGCPACGTMFRVVPDQLRISEGWVRCGHCAEVFDATAHMMERVPVEALDPANTEPADLPTQPPQWDFPPAPAPRAPASAAPRAEPLASPPVEAGPDSEALEPSPLDAPFVFRRSDLDFAEPVPSVLPPLSSPVSPPAAARARDSVLPEPDEPPPDIDEVSFVRQARRKAFWRRPMVRLSLTLASVLFAFVLALQLAYQDRDRLAVMQPQLKPWLAQMCELLPCRLGPPRQIEAIVIESSSFNKLRGDAYRLSFTLRNTAAVEVATPAMELTLTDAQDQTVLRRVLTPAELGARGNVIEAASDWSGAIGITVAAAGGPARVAGYRLLAFYP